MTPELLHLEPQEAVASARTAGIAAEVLDRYLLARALRFLLDRQGDHQALGLALVDAIDIVREQAGPWAARWRVLLELLREARKAPSAARDLEAARPTGRSAELICALAREVTPTQPSALADVLRMKRPQVSHLISELEEADLVYRQRAGRDVWVVLTPRGQRLAQVLGTPKVDLEDQDSAAPRIRFWTSPVEHRQ